MKVGDISIDVVTDGTLLIDGGALFGPVPKIQWEKNLKPDRSNRVRISLNCILIQLGSQNILIDTGIGAKRMEKLKESYEIIYLKKTKSDFIHGFEVDIFKLKIQLNDGTVEESTRWITKHGVTLKEHGIIDGKEGKAQFYSEFSNVRVFKQDERTFEIPEGYTLAPMDQLDDVNELLKLMVKRI